MAKAVGTKGPLEIIADLLPETIGDIDGCDLRIGEREISLRNGTCDVLFRRTPPPHDFERYVVFDPVQCYMGDELVFDPLGVPREVRGTLQNIFFDERLCLVGTGRTWHVMLREQVPGGPACRVEVVPKNGHGHQPDLNAT